MRSPSLPSLTVVIPSRGRPEILTQTLRALAWQNVGGFSVIVVLDGPGQERPSVGLEALTYVEQEHAGPGIARNLGVSLSSSELVLFLGDDMIPAPGLVSAHLARHVAEPDVGVAVLGHVDWHPTVASGRIERWLDWSGSQFDYRQLAREHADGSDEAGFGRFYSSNVSLKRPLLERAGGFDPDFVFDYEDLDLGWRLAQLGMKLRYEPSALALHLHAQSLDGVRARYAAHARGEWTMASKHSWFEPWFHARVSGYDRNPPTSAVWPLAVDHVRGPLRGYAEERASSWYHQAVAEEFMGAWEGERGLAELRAYLGSAFDVAKLHGHVAAVDAEASSVGDEDAFYRRSHAYLYDLTAFAMTGTKDVYRRELRRLVAPGARLLDYGCGIGTDGLRLLEAGYAVEFADFANPSIDFLRWRLGRRGVSAPVHDLDGIVPGGYDLAYAFDVIEHVEDPFAFLAELETRAAIVVVNLLEPFPGETALHRPLPIKDIVRRARRRGKLLHHRVYHGRSHLLAYRSPR